MALQSPSPSRSGAAAPSLSVQGAALFAAHGSLALLQAVTDQQWHLVAELAVMEEININAADALGRTILIHCVQFAPKELALQLVKTLVNAKAKVSIEGPEGLTALHYAVKLTKSELVGCFVVYARQSLNCKDVRGRTPLHWAATMGDQEAGELYVQMLNFFELSKNPQANVITNLRDNDGKTAEQLYTEFVHHGRKSSVSPILHAPVDHSASLLPPSRSPSPPRRFTDLHLIAQRCSESMPHQSRESFLLKKKAYAEEANVTISEQGDTQQRLDYVNALDQTGYPALYYALRSKNNFLVRLLLKEGANANVLIPSQHNPVKTEELIHHFCQSPEITEDSFAAMLQTQGINAIHHAAMSKNGGDALRKLCAHNGTNLDQPYKDGLTPLWLALRTGNFENAAILIDAGALIHLTDRNQFRALDIAVEAGATEVVRKLCVNKAHVNTLAGDGFSPLYRACLYGHTAIVQILLEHGADPRTIMVPTEPNREMGNEPFTVLDYLARSRAVVPHLIALVESIVKVQVPAVELDPNHFASRLQLTPPRSLSTPPEMNLAPSTSSGLNSRASPFTPSAQLQAQLLQQNRSSSPHVPSVVYDRPQSPVQVAVPPHFASASASGSVAMPAHSVQVSRSEQAPRPVIYYGPLYQQGWHPQGAGFIPQQGVQVLPPISPAHAFQGFRPTRL
jgi:ankyrin repeat protein